MEPAPSEKISQIMMPFIEAQQLFLDSCSLCSMALVNVQSSEMVDISYLPIFS